MRRDEISTVGVMFDARPDDEHPDQFPRFRDLGYSWHELLSHDELVPDDLRDWWVIAYDPRGFSYADEDRRAMDVTNWDAIVRDVTGVDESEVPKVRATMNRVGYVWTLEGVDEARETGYAIIGSVLAIAPVVPRDGIDEDGYDEDGFWHEDERACRLDLARDLSKALSDYPLLDEEAYSEREYEAWCEYASNGLDFDTLRELPDLDDDTRDALQNAWESIWPAMSGASHYYDGFTGEIGPEPAELLATVVVDALSRTLTN